MEKMVMDQLDDYYKGKKVLVTGHTGFKGAWLSIILKKLGAEVIGIAKDPKTKKDIYHQAHLERAVKDYRQDISNLEEILKVFKKEQPEVVFHLAAQALVLDSYSEPLETFQTNIMGTVNILEAIRKTDTVKTAVFITTDKVYENKEWIWPYREDEPIGGYDPYSASKGAAEIVIASYRNSFFNPKSYKRHGVSVASVRAGNVIGGGDWSANRIIPDCVRSLRRNQIIEVRNPRAQRPWQHVLEPLFGYLILGSKMMENPLDYNEAWNFGPEMTNVVDVEVLVQKIISFYGEGQWKDISEPNALHEANYLSLDINKVKNRLQWKPILDIDTTLEMTVKWYKEYQNQDVLNLCNKQIEQYIELWRSRNGK